MSAVCPVNEDSLPFLQIPGGKKFDSVVVNGFVCTKNIAHKKVGGAEGYLPTSIISISPKMSGFIHSIIIKSNCSASYLSCQKVCSMTFVSSENWKIRLFGAFV